MPALNKVLFLFFLFIFFNIFLIFFFNYKDYFYPKETIIEIEQKEKSSFFGNKQYKNSEFKIRKINNLLELSGTFSNADIPNKLIKQLYINEIGQISYDETMVVNLKNLNEIKKLALLLKNYFNDNSEIIISQDKTILSGSLKHYKYKPLVEAYISYLDESGIINLNIIND